MRSIIRIVLCLIAALTCAHVNGQAAWKEFVSGEVGFRVMFPGEPIRSVSEKSEGEGKIRIFYLSSMLGEQAFVVSASRQPDFPLTMTEDQLNDVYTKARNDGVAGLDSGKVIKESKVRIGKTPGREVFYQGEAGMVRQRMFVYKQKLFLISALYPPSNGGRDVDKFLNSFKFLD